MLDPIPVYAEAPATHFGGARWHCFICGSSVGIDYDMTPLVRPPGVPEHIVPATFVSHRKCMDETHPATMLLMLQEVRAQVKWELRQLRN